MKQFLNRGPSERGQRRDKPHPSIGENRETPRQHPTTIQSPLAHKKRLPRVRVIREKEGEKNRTVHTALPLCTSTKTSMPMPSRRRTTTSQPPSSVIHFIETTFFCGPWAGGTGLKRFLNTHKETAAVCRCLMWSTSMFITNHLTLYCCMYT